MVNNLVLLIYRNRFFLLYSLFGLMSLVTEQIINILLSVYLNNVLSILLSIATGICVAYFLNVTFNFKVPKKRLRSSMFYFAVVSLFSLLIQYSFSRVTNLSFASNRYLISGLLFFIGYIFHRKLSFKDKQTTGIAIHLNDKQNLDEIFDKVKTLPDFIHADLIDDTYNRDNISIDLEILNKIKSLWPNKNIQLHIMSNKPLQWIRKINTNIDEIFVHLDIGIDNIRKIDYKNLGVVINTESNPEEINFAVENFTRIMILCIEKPGYSGQKFFEEIESVIEEVSKKIKNKNIKLVLDGGMTPAIASRYSVDEIVTASSVLENKFSKLQLTNFQESKDYIS